MNSKIKILVDDKEIDYYTFADELRNGDYFFKEKGEWYLHKRPTIIEDKKIEKIDQNDHRWHYGYNKKTDENVIDNLELLREKVNKIIDYLDKEN